MSYGKADPPSSSAKPHLAIRNPSEWIIRFAPLIREGGPVLDLAAGGGRHGRYYLERGHPVTLVDRQTEALLDLEPNPRATVIQADLEDGSPWPLNEKFAGVVVVNYLHRPLTENLLESLEPGGLLIYETFARGNENFSRPRNPDHLLKSGELLQMVLGRLQVIAYEHGIREKCPLPGVIQRICAVNNLGQSVREDREPQVLKLEPN